MFAKIYRLLLPLLFITLISTSAQTVRPQGWSVRLDGGIQFYQSTELGVLLVGTERSLYAVDGETGETLWRRKNLRVDETDVTPVVGTDLALVSLEKSGKSRIEAVDVFTGTPVWKSEKIKGSVMQFAVDPQRERIALVMVRDPYDGAREGFRRKPIVHMLDLSNGEERWRHELDSDVEMLPGRWSENEDEKTFYTLDNYRAPLFLDERLYLFYEGVTSLEIEGGKERIRERFRVNEEGLALSEADPVADDRYLYVSGRGRVRAISRETGREVWEARDLGVTPEIVATRGVLFVRTGGLFTRLRDGEVVERGPFGISAIESATGKVLWRFKGADRGISNLALLDMATVVIADRDEIVTVDANTGKPALRLKHQIDRASFVLINEPGQIVVGGGREIAAFLPARKGNGKDNAIWRARHDPPGRGALRTIAAITARAAAIYFRYGGVATTAFRGAQLARAAGTLRWSGLAGRVVLPSLGDYAAGAGRGYITGQIKGYGVLSRLDATQRTLRSVRSRQINPGAIIDVDVEERLLDRLDPSSQLTKLSRFLFRRKQLAALRGKHLYFFTNLQNDAGKGLAGVNLNTGETERTIRTNEPDPRLTTDEIAGLLYSAKGDRLYAYSLY